MGILDDIFGAEENESLERRKVRRMFAQIACAQVFLITAVFLASMFFDQMSARVAQAWPPFVIMYPSLLAYLMHYTHVGSKETSLLFQAKAETAVKTPRSTDARTRDADRPPPHVSLRGRGAPDSEIE